MLRFLLRMEIQGSPPVSPRAALLRALVGPPNLLLLDALVHFNGVCPHNFRKI